MTGKHLRKCYFCFRCDNAFKSTEARDKHQKKCFGLRTRKYPPRNSETGEIQKMKFKTFEGLSRCPFVCYGDSKCFLKPEYKIKRNTKLVQEHIASSWGFVYFGPKKREYFDFFPPNLTEGFVRRLVKLAEEIFN